jgi:flagellar basal body-associated protein FliL
MDSMLLGLLVALIVMFLFTMTSIFLWFISGKQWWFYLKAKLGRKKGFIKLVTFKNGKFVEEKIIKYPEDIKFDKDSLFIGAEVKKPQYFDAVTGLPVIYVFQGSLTTTDFRDIIMNNKILKKAFEKYPGLVAELEKIETTDSLGNKSNLLKYALEINPSDKEPETKLEDIVNFQMVRAYNLGLLKGRQENKSLGGMSPIMLIFLFVILMAAVAGIYYGYKNHDAIVEIKAVLDTIAKSNVSSVIIPGK